MGVAVDVASWWERLPDGLRRRPWMRPDYPLVGVEIREDAVVAVRLVRKSGGYRLAGHGIAALEPGTFTSSIVRPSIGAPEALAAAVGSVLRQAGAERAGRVSLALPDTFARVFMLDFRDLPKRREQVGEVVKWRLKKSIPFPLEEARLSWHLLGRGDDGREMLLVAVSRREAVVALEGLLEGLGLRVGLIDLATFDLLNALRLDGAFDVDSGRDTALLSATPTYFSFMIVRGGRLIFYRAKNYHVKGRYRGEESLRVVVRELRSTLSYYEEHLLGEGIETLHARVVGIDPEGLIGVAREAGCGAVRDAAVRRVVPELADAPQEEVLELLPALGLALRREP
ncbi:MAG: hypothetical protein D6718_07295 [Acidobacteria bacterium]|nr:MAG: hypothetical protein D6718_07295 [Acidobacteriota bacterium]